MRKKYNREEEDKKFRARVRRNWIITVVTLILIIICYYFV